MESLEYDFCNLTDREEDPFSDYDLCNSTDSDQAPPVSPKDSDNDSLQSDDMDTQDYLDKLQICPQNPIFRPTSELYAGENRKLRGYMGLEDVIKEHALSFLPAKSLLRFRTVCKNWDRWICNPFLAHKQANNFRNVSGLILQIPDRNPSFISLNPRLYGIPELSTFLPETTVHVRAATGGLICCQGRFGDDCYYVCNPAVKEWRKLPRPRYYHGEDPAVVLAFEPSTVRFTANYELVCAFQIADDDLVCFEIYSSRTDSWRVSETVCCELEGGGPKRGGLYMNGYAYFETSTGIVMAFNLIREDLGFVVLPPASGPHGVLTEMQGELCYIVPTEEWDGALTMQMYGDLNMSLQKTVRISNEYLEHMGVTLGEVEVRALGCVGSDGIVFLAGNQVFAYNVESGAESLGWDYNLAGGRYLPYVNSLVSVAPLVQLEESEFSAGICSGEASLQLSLVQDMF